MYVHTPTDQIYDALGTALGAMNDRLFGGKLPAVVISIQRRSRRTKGYFTEGNFKAVDSSDLAHEIALNPAYFQESPRELLATLVHELCHLWQHKYGKPGRGRYHNREWAEKMVELGLQPSDTGLPGGKTTGQRMGQYVIPAGMFEFCCCLLDGEGWTMRWAEIVAPKSEHDAPEEEVEAKGRVAWKCPNGCLLAWARPGARLKCGSCDQMLVRR